MRPQSPILAIFLIAQTLGAFADKKCNPVSLQQNRSVVCMCTAEYCDEITRIEPSKDEYITYISSQDGLRFDKRVGELVFHNQSPEISDDDNTPVLFLDPSVQYQTIEGFGGSVTDSAGINWNRLTSAKLKQHFVDSYFGKRGLEYNMMRTPIGGSDFSTHPYAYNEHPVGDVKLSNFTLAEEDYKYKLPLIKKCMKAAQSPVHIVATTWSPPGWMKTNDAIYGTPSLLKLEYYQAYADYHLKFLKEYKKQGVPVWAITTTNEPTNALLLEHLNFNSLGWTVDGQGIWIAENLGPTIRNSPFKDVKILCMDDQRNQLSYYVNNLINLAPAADQYIDGVAAHFYQNKLIPPDQVTYSMREFPDKFIISTEACMGFDHSPSVDLGAWRGAEYYMNDILIDLNYNYTGWIDWNMCLNMQGGPNWADNYVDSPILVSDDGNSFYKQPTYYALGHVSKFLPRGSRRIQVDQPCGETVQNVAFVTPRNTIVTVLLNTGDATAVNLVTCKQQAKVFLEKKSIATVEFRLADC